MSVPSAGTAGRCTVKRIKGVRGMRLTRFELWCEGSNVKLMTAVKQANGVVELYDETRGSKGKRYSKKNGNFVGKLKPNRTRSVFELAGPRKGQSLGCVHCRKSTKKGVLSSAHLHVLLPPMGQGELAGKPVVLTNKPPQRVQTARSGYRLNFGGRVKLASVKNFQIIRDCSPDDVLMQFGRVAKDDFICDFQAPFTPVQAFAVCLIQMK